MEEIANKKLTKAQITEEFIKISLDIEYFALNYCKVKDKAKGVIGPFKVMPTQKKVLKAYMENDYVGVLKYRQGGITTVTILYVCWLICTQNDLKIAIVADKLKLSITDIVMPIHNMLMDLPEWLRPTLSIDRQELKQYSNGCVLKAVAASKDGLRGMSPDYLIIDEAAYLQYGEAFWTSASGTLSVAGKCIMISTPNGQDPVYFAQYEASRIGESGFHFVEIKWYEDIRFNKGLVWKQGNEIMVEGEEALDETKFNEYIQLGYKASSPWYVTMCKTYFGDKKRIAQEIENSFIGSGGAMIHDEDLIRHERIAKTFPFRELNREPNLWIFEDPIPTEDYVLSADVASGGEDYSTFQIVRIDKVSGKLIQVAEYQNKVKNDVLAPTVFEFGRLYNFAYLVVDVTGSHGLPLVERLIELKYPNLHYSDYSTSAISERIEGLESFDGKKPGFIVGGGQIRQLILAKFEEMVRLDTLQIRSVRLISEMKTFVWMPSKNRYDHTRTKHDDLLFAMAIACYVVEYSIIKSKNNKEGVKNMLDSWTFVRQDDIYSNKWMNQDSFNEQNIKKGIDSGRNNNLPDPFFFL
jgi:hypothetical protein